MITISDKEKKRHKRKRRVKERIRLLVFLFPVFFFVILFLAFPLISSAYISLTDVKFFSFTEPHNFIGFNGYIDTILNDTNFHDALQNQLFYGVSYFFITFTLSLLLALLLNELTRAEGFFQVLFYLPMIIPLSIVGGIFMWIFSGTTNGLFNIILNNLGLGQVPPFSLYADFDWALFGLVMARVWKMTGFTLIIFLAGLKGIPQQLREAAKIDGANKFKELFHIVLPLLKPYLFIGAIWILINSMKEFDLPAVVTWGGPGNATVTMYFRAWRLAFVHHEMGKAAQVSFIIAFIILTLAFILNKIFRTETAQRH